MTAVTPNNKATELQNRVREIDADISRLDDEYFELAGSFDGGNQSILKQADAIEIRINQLRREKALVIAASAQLIKQQQAEAEAAQQDQHREKLVEARKHASAIAAIAVDIDRQLAVLVELFKQHHAACRLLSQTGVVDHTLMNRLSGKQAGTRAACATQLQQFMSIERVAPQSHLGMASANSALLRIGQSDDAVLPRRKLVNGNGSGS